MKTENHKDVKGPNHEIFGSRVFLQSNPEWVGDLGIWPKNKKFDGLGLKIAILYFLAYKPSTLKILSALA
jgi:hypothetical protein